MHPDFEGIDTHGTEHLARVNFLLEELNVLHIEKETSYKGSWAKRGWHGVFFNVVRPWDRIANTFLREDGVMLKPNVTQRYLFDALMDVALYCLKMAAVLVDMDRSLYTNWAEENLRRVRDWPYDEIETD